MAIAAAAMSGSRAADDDDGHSHDLVMPGFRFHPTEEELIEFYLRRKVEGKRFNVDLIAFLDLYRYDPWELPELATIGEKEWYFYVPRDRKYRNGDRPNRVTTSGYWKATGADRMIKSESSNRGIGLKKTLVFYTGKAPKGVRTSWIMNEYRLPHHHHHHHNTSTSSSFDQGSHHLINYSQHTTEISLCRVYKRAGVEDHCQLPATLNKPSSSSRPATAFAGINTRHPPPPHPRRQLNILGTGVTTPLAGNDPCAPPRLSSMESIKVPRSQPPTRSTIYGSSPTTAAAPPSELEDAGAASTCYLHPMPVPLTRSSLLLAPAAATDSSMPEAAAPGADELNRFVSYSSSESLSTTEQQNPQLLLQMPHQQQIVTLNQLPAMSLPMISEKMWEWWNPNNISEAAGKEYFTDFK